MRVVMIGPFGLRPKGTMSVRALPLAKVLAARGHQVTLLLPPWNWPVHSGQVWTEDGVTVENLRLPPRVPGLWHLLLAWRLVRRALALRPDMVHCFKPKAYSGLAALILWGLKRLRLIHTRLIVDADDWEGDGGWNDLENYTWAQKRFFAWQERWGLRHHDALTVASRTLESIVWSLGVPSERVHYLPNGVRGFRLEDARTRRGAGNTVILYTRFFEFELERVARVFGSIHQARPNVRFVIVGKGLFGEEDRFLALCRSMGLAEAVEYAGWVEVEALPGYFARVDVALYPFDDTLVNRAKCAVKLLDLMAAGVPVVAESVGQNVVTIEHGVSGLLVPPDEEAAFSTAAIRLLDDSDLRERMGRGAKQRILERFTWEGLALRVEQVYTGEIGRRQMTVILEAVLKRFRRRPLLYWLPLLIWMGLIYWFSDQPQPFTVSQSWLQDAIGVMGHLIGYGVLALLWWRMLAARRGSRPRRALGLAFLLTMLYALSDEYHQTFVPGRSGNLPDLLVDAAGASLALWLVQAWQNRSHLKKRP